MLVRRTLRVYGITVGGVCVGVGGAGVVVIVGVDDGVKVMRGVRVGRFVGVSVGVVVGVKVGARTFVGVMSASTGYSSCMA